MRQTTSPISPDPMAHGSHARLRFADEDNADKLRS